MLLEQSSPIPGQTCSTSDCENKDASEDKINGLYNGATENNNHDTVVDSSPSTRSKLKLSTFQIKSFSILLFYS